MLLASGHARRVGTFVAIVIGTALGGCSLILGADFHDRKLATGGSSSAGGAGGSGGTGGAGGRCSNAGGGGSSNGTGVGGMCTASPSAPPLWTQHLDFGSTGVSQTGLVRLVENLGNVTVVGNFGGVEGNQVTVGSKNASSAGAGDVYLVELDASSGSPQSVRAFGDKNPQFAYGFSGTIDQNFLIGGTTTGNLSFGCQNGLSAGQANDPFLAVLDPRGNASKSRLLPLSGTDSVAAVSAVAAGTVVTNMSEQLVAIGSFDGTLAFDSTHSSPVSLPTGFLVRYDSELGYLGSELIEVSGSKGSVQASPVALAFAPDGSAIVGGTFRGKLEGCTLSTSKCTSYAFKSSFAASYPNSQSTGNPQWIQAWNDGLDEGVGALAYELNGAGRIALVRDTSLGMTIEILDEHGVETRKISTLGTAGLAAVFEGNSIMVGGEVTTATFDAAQCAVGPTTIDPPSIFVASFDVVSGNCNWVRAYPASPKGAVEAMSIDTTHGRLFVGGTFSGTLNFGSTTMTAVTSDVFVTSFCL